MTSNPSPAANQRWTFLRDVVVFQIKLLLDNLRDLVLMPVALGAAVIDLLYRGEREGALFYKVLRWGLHSEEVIDVYSAIEHHDPGRFKVSEAFTVDGVIARLENVVTREVEKGGTAATIKTAMDRAIDQLHSETGSARDAVVRTAGKLREKLGREEGGV
ncbi:MAG TPA: hypothetical protein VH188_13975 [Chthoniobacterales bacterium]|jgi:hypothetical protein|nr:hypothetical protein [Chthoniobacterales bacterium]